MFPRLVFKRLGTLLAVSGAALAQADFRPGYIIQPAGDTLRGEIDNRSTGFIYATAL